MKKIITGTELQEKMEQAIQLLCEPVKDTLGPRGKNVMIESSNLPPFITNDGVTIAENIESEEEGIKTILELAKESSMKTNEVVGDGTTTTLLLLENLFKNGLYHIKQGIHPMIIKEELEKTTQEVINKLKGLKRKASKKMLKNIAKISANDEEIGNLVYEAFQITKNKNAILIEEQEERKNSLNIFQGYYFSSTLASSYFLKNKSKQTFEDVCILLFHKECSNINKIEEILNEIMEQKRSLVIISESFDEYMIQTFASLVIDGKLNCCLLKLEEYGLREQMIMKDLEIITRAKKIPNDDFSI